MDTKLFVRRQKGGMFSIVDREMVPTGNIFWVDSTNTTNGSNAAGYGDNPDRPFLTLVYAETQASTDDTIYVMPGHTETLSSATGAVVLTLDVTGLKIIGLGGRTRRPTFLVDGHANNYITITAADTRIENCIFESGHSDVAKCFNVAAAGVQFVNCDILDNTTNENFLIGILTTNAADDLLVEGCRIISTDTACTEGIEVVGACNRMVIRNNFIKGAFGVSCISCTTAACLETLIADNYLVNLTAGDDLAGCIDMVASSTGFIANNCCYMEDNTDCLTSIDAAACGRCGNYCANENGEEGGVAGTAST